MPNQSQGDSQIINDQRFAKSLAKARARYTETFQRAANFLQEPFYLFLRDEYIISRSPGQPFTNFYLRYFLQRAVAAVQGKEDKFGKQFEKLMRVFDQAARAHDEEAHIVPPVREELEAVADRYIALAQAVDASGQDDDGPDVGIAA